MQNKGHFFVFEGIDGSGKSTQISLLKQRIEQAGHRCLQTKEPTDGPIGSMVHQCMTGRICADERTISTLFAADRLDHLLNSTNGIMDKINAGDSVISDRYVLSNYAYQGVTVPLEWLIKLNEQAAGIITPDCHIFIDVDPDISMERMAKGRFHQEIYETKERLTAVRNRYFELFDFFSDSENIKVIDGNQSIEKISEDIWNIVSPFYH